MGRARVDALEGCCYRKHARLKSFYLFSLPCQATVDRADHSSKRSGERRKHHEVTSRGRCGRDCGQLGDLLPHPFHLIMALPHNSLSLRLFLLHVARAEDTATHKARSERRPQRSSFIRRELDTLCRSCHPGADSSSAFAKARAHPPSSVRTSGVGELLPDWAEAPLPAGWAST